MANEIDKLNIRKSISSYRDYVDELIVDAIVKPVGKSKESYAEKFIANYLSSALKNTSSREASHLADILLKSNVLENMDIALRKSKSDDIAFQKYKLRQTLYDKQQEVFDNEIDNRIVIINSRRSGKTELLGRLAARELLDNPDAHIVYLNRSSTVAIRQIRGPLDAALNATDIKITSGSVSSQEIHFSTGGQMLILGNNNSADVDRTRGERISLCILDECGHQRNMRQLIREVIGPALKDYGKDAQLVIVGTPPRIPHTYVEECWNNPYWKKYHWTFLDNPFIPDRDKVIEEVCKENGCDESSAFIQREYYGRMDAYDDEARVWKKYSTVVQPRFEDEYKHIWDYAYVGVDWGFEDKAAVVSCLVDSKAKRMFVIDNWSKSKQSITTICEEVKRQYEQLKQYPIARQPWIITDTNEKGAAFELYQTYKLQNVYMAYKYDKDIAIEQLSDWLSADTIQLIRGKCDNLEEDLQSTLYERDEETGKLLHEIDDDIWHPNSAMALLYVSRQFSVDALGFKAYTPHTVQEGLQRDES